MEKNRAVMFFQTVEKAAREANFAALDEHRRMGRSVPMMRAGEIVWLGPEEIAQVLAARVSSKNAN
jgi:hypothetical protein